MNIFNEYSKYYDLIYSDKDYDSETDYLETLFELNTKPKNILEFGCGTGIHASILAKKKYNVHGIDSSSDMVRIAKNNISALPKQTQKRLTFECADACNFKSNKLYDTVISIFHVFCYQTTNQDIEKMLKNAYNHIQGNGIFIFDIWFTPAILSSSLDIRYKSFENNDVLIKRYSRPELRNNNTLDIHYDIHILNKIKNSWSFVNETHNVRFFGLPEIEYFAEKTGFKFICSEEWITRKVPSSKSWSVTIVLKKA